LISWAFLEWRCVGNFDVADKLFRRVLETNPQDVFALYGLGRLHLDQGNYSIAEEMFDRATKLKKTTLETFTSSATPWGKGIAWAFKGETYCELLRFREARECFERGVLDDPANPIVYIKWTKLEAQTDNIGKAREVISRGLDNTLNSRDACWLLLGKAWLSNFIGLYNETRNNFQLALQRDRWSIDARLYWARWEAKQGEMSTARQLYEEAAAIDPRNPRVWEYYQDAEMLFGDEQMAEDLIFRGETEVTKEVLQPKIRFDELPSDELQIAAMAAQNIAASIEEPDEEDNKPLRSAEV